MIELFSATQEQIKEKIENKSNVKADKSLSVVIEDAIKLYFMEYGFTDRTWREL